MDIFGIQDSRRKQTAILVLCFAAAMIVMALIVHVVVNLLMAPFSSGLHLSTPSLFTKFTVAVICLISIGACCLRMLDVRAGGAALARRFGGVEADGSGRYRNEQALLDIVSEMAGHSRCDVPRTFILHRETSINAMAFGGFSGNEVIVISQGAIDRLTQDELSAVIAHEIGHIAQGDVPVNMQLLIAISGLNAIDKAGKRIIGKRQNRSRFHPRTVVGNLVRAIGLVGTFFGKLLRATLSRQKAYRADACAVQYTRQPDHLVSVLTRLDRERESVGIDSIQAEELAHLCFQVGDSSHWYQKLISTHPSIQDRVDAVRRHNRSTSTVGKAANGSTNTSVHSVGNGVRAASMQADVDTVLPISDQAAMVLTDVASCVALLHAIFVSSEAGKSKLYYSAIAFAYNKLFALQVKEIRESLDFEIRSNKMALVEQATSQIRDSIKIENRQRLLKSLEKLLLVEGEFTLMNYATLQLVRRKLDAEFPVLQQVIDGDVTQATASRVKTVDTMGKEFALLLSLVVEASGSNNVAQDAQFQLALKCYTKEHHPRRFGDEPGLVKELEASFQTLYVQPRPIREAFVKHCLEIAQSDGRVAKNERSMLNLFAASLQCDLLAA